MSTDIEDVVALERRFWTSANDPGFFARAMAEEGITVIEPMGSIEKSKVVE